MTLSAFFRKQVLDKNVGQSRVHERSSSMHGPYGREQVPVHASFQNVAGGTGSQHRSQVRWVIVHCEDKHAGFPAGSHDLLKRTNSAGPRHRKVHQRYIWLCFARRLNRLLSIGSFRDDFHIGLGIDQQFQSRAQNGVIVGNHDSDLGFSRGHPRRPAHQ